MNPVRTAANRVCQITPSYFSDRSLIGGGERYAEELARALARRVPTTLLSLGREAVTRFQGQLRWRVLRARCLQRGHPLSRVSLALLPELAAHDIIHCHQYPTPLSDLALLIGATLRKRVFITPLGGSSVSLAYHIDLARLAAGTLHISRYSETAYRIRARASQVIWGGVDPDRFCPPEPRGDRSGVLFVGRLLPHKGIDYLVRAADPRIHVRLVGRPYDTAYLAYLRRLADGKDVAFVLDADDEVVLRAYQSARVAVLPSVYQTYDGRSTAIPELLGLVVLEAMACGTPVIVTNVGALPEIVRDGETGFVVPPNDPEALRDRIQWLLDHPRQAEAMGQRGREHVLAHFTWDHVAARCLAAYAATTNEIAPLGTLQG